MCRSTTVFIAVLLAATGLPAPAQQSRSVGLSASLEWRSIGNTVLEAGLGSPAGGPIDRVWFSTDGSTIYARTAKGRTWRTADLEKWSPVELGEALPSTAQVNGQRRGLGSFAKGASLLRFGSLSPKHGRNRGGGRFGRVGDRLMGERRGQV